MLFKLAKSLSPSISKPIHSINTIRYLNTVSKPQQIEEYQSELVVDCKNILGECPIWDFRRELLCWIDILDAKFWTYNPANNQSYSYDLPDCPGSFALCDSSKFDEDTYLFAFSKGPAFYNISSGKIIGDRIFEFEPDKATRTNDGRVDKQGRFVFGGMDDPFDVNKPGFESAVYRINKDLTYRKILNENIACTNSICFSKDGKTMYFSDSFGAYEKRSILKYSYYEDDKMPDNRQIFGCFDRDDSRLQIKKDELCFVDGSIVDNEDGVWNSGCGSSRVWRFNKDGIIDKVVRVPEPYVSCAAFGGKDLDIMYITTLATGHELTGIEKGGLYAVKLPVKGCKEDVFLGK